MFQEYCNNIDNARLRIESCMKLETFKRAFRKCQEDQRAKGLNLQNWLMRPNQHLMRQPLLLEALLKNTPKEHPDHDRLLQGLNKAKEIVQHIDENKHAHAQAVKLVALHGRLRGHFEELVVPSRHLLREGAMHELHKAAVKPGAAALATLGTSNIMGERETTRRTGGEERTTSMRRRTINVSAATASTFARSAHYGFLCNDSLWYCEALRGNKYKVIHVFHFAQKADLKSPEEPGMSLTYGGHESAGASYSFTIADAEMTVTVRLANNDEADQWVAVIEEHLKALHAARHGADDDVAEAGGAADGAGPPPLAAAPAPSNLPKPSERYIAQYNARHNLSGGASLETVGEGQSAV